MNPVEAWRTPRTTTTLTWSDGSMGPAFVSVVTGSIDQDTVKNLNRELQGVLHIHEHESSSHMWTSTTMLHYLNFLTIEIRARRMDCLFMTARLWSLLTKHRSTHVIPLKPSDSSGRQPTTLSLSTGPRMIKLPSRGGSGQLGHPTTASTSTSTNFVGATWKLWWGKATLLRWGVP